MGGNGARAALLFGMGLAWLAGVGLQLHERSLSSAAAYAGGEAAALVAGLAACAWPRVRWALLVCAAVAGFCGTGWRAQDRLADHLPAALEGQDLEIVGIVAGLPQRSSSGLRFRFEVESATWRGEPVDVPRQLSLGWYTGWHEDAALSEPQLALRAGQRWRLAVRLRQPSGNLNPHGFDHELHLFEQGLRATGYVRGEGASSARLIEPHAGRVVDRLRQAVRDAIDAHVADPRAAGVLAALAVGDQSAITREDWQLFRDTGVAHLMSISGLHVTMFAWLAGGAIGWAWRRSRRAMHRLPAPWAARIGGLAAAAAYAVFAGWGVPAQRTVWMLATVTALQLIGRRWPWSWVLVAAAVVVSALDPWALLQPGFWLSFMAVGLLMASEPARTWREDTPPGLRARIFAAVRAGLRTQAIATVGLAPLSLVFFQQLSLVGFVANLVAIPVVTLVVTPIALLGVAVPMLWGLGAWVLELLTRGLALLAMVPGAVWQAPVAPGWAQLAGLAAAGLFALPLPWRLRLLAVPMVLPLLWPRPDVPAAGRFEMLAVDVGQGTAVLVRTHGHLLVYDSGPRYSRDSDAGERVLLPLLRARGETRIDRLVLSHRDLDHVGGAAPLLAALPVGELLSSLEEGHPLHAAATHSARCEAGQAWTWDGVRFEVLHPRADDYALVRKSNAMSCVLKVTAAQGSVLLAGDIERQQEAELLARGAPALRSDVLLVPHHGSRTSSTAAFLEAVAPRVAVVQAGYRNRFGHPAGEVVGRLTGHGIAIAASPDCGAWQWAGEAHDAHADPPIGRCERDRGLRYWHRPANRR